MDCQLHDKVALVTGASRGLGRAIALALASEGAHLVVADLADTAKTAEAVTKLGQKCLPVRTDVSDENQVDHLFEKIESEYGRLDILVNNAGITQASHRPTTEAPADEWDRIIQVNLRGVFLCCRRAGRMMQNHGGSIVNISSTAGSTGVPRAAAYSASKAGVNLLTKSLALEWAPHNIRVNAVAPHYLETDMSRGLRDSGDVYQKIINQIPLRRFGKPSEIVAAVVLLASAAGGYITGEVLAVDGGYLAR